MAWLEKAVRWCPEEKLRAEKEALVFYITSHPLDKYQAEIRRLSGVTTEDLSAAPDGSHVSIAGVIHAVKLKNNRAGKRYATFTLQDLNRVLQALARPEIYHRPPTLIHGHEPV